ncbi:hypothetical protein P9112_002651 [Eukaryota sp. TZLM1-RC]
MLRVLPLFNFLVSLTFLDVVAVFVRFTPKDHIPTIFFISCAFFATVAFLHCVVVDPGKIGHLNCLAPSNFGLSEPLPAQISVVYHNNPSVFCYCYKCQVYTPPHSYHSKHLDTCLLNHDHYCGFLKCEIAARNRFSFLFFIIFSWFALVFILVIILSNVLFMKKSFGIPFTGLLILHFIFISLLLHLQLRSLASGLTTRQLTSPFLEVGTEKISAQLIPPPSFVKFPDKFPSVSLIPCLHDV